MYSAVYHKDNNIKSIYKGVEKVFEGTLALFVSYSIPLEVSVSSNAYNINQIGTNNPTLTCFRGTNYDFVVNTASHPFALRVNLNDTVNEVQGSYNNNPTNGIVNNTIMFTPNNNTPNTIFYQCSIHSNMNGTIYIKDY